MSDLEPEDKALVRRMLAGDDDAFEAFFDGYFPALYRFALTRLDRNEDAAEEVVQATLGKAISKLSTYRGEAALFTWLCTFCRHEISAYFQRHRQWRHHVELAEDLPEVRTALASLAAVEAGRASESAQREELARLVQVVLDHLPPRYGDALEWKYLQGLSVKEIAARLGVGPKAAESLLTRARDAFRAGYAELAPVGEENG